MSTVEEPLVSEVARTAVAVRVITEAGLLLPGSRPVDGGVVDGLEEDVGPD